MSLHQLANHMSARGRGPDSTLVHMSPREVEGLQKLAVAHGTTLTINPDTGLPEAFSLESLLPTLAGAALNYFLPGVGTAIGEVVGLGSAAGTGLAVGAATAALTGDLGKGLSAGLGAYGGAGITDSLAGMGAAQLGSQAVEEGVGQKLSDQALQESVANRMASATMSDKVGAGLSYAGSNPMSALKIGGKYLAAAAAPMFAGEVGNTVQTVTPRQSTGRIRPFTYDPYEQAYTRGTPYAAAKGGLMGLAHGGAVRRFDEGGIAEMYQSVLGRAPDAGGAAFWQQQFGADNKVDANELAAFRASALGGTDTADKTAAQSFGAPASTTGQGFAATAPVAQATPVAQAPVAQAPVAQAPVVQAPVAQAPVAQAPVAQAPVAQAPVAQAPVAQAGIAALPSASALVAQSAPVASNNAMSQQQGPLITDQVYDLFKNVLDRPPSESDMKYWATQFGINNNTIDPNEVADFKSAASKELAARTADFASSQKYIPISQLDNLYMQELSRHGEYGKDGKEGGMEFWKRTFGDYINPEELAGFRTEAAKERDAREKATRPTVVTDLTTADTTYVKPGVGGSTGAGQVGGGTVINPNGTITTSPVIPGIPVGGFKGMEQVRDAYTTGGGSLGYTSYAPKTIDEFNTKYTNTGYQKEMYDYLMGRGDKPTKMKNADGTFREIMRPYKEATLGVPASTNKRLTWDPVKGKYFTNPDYVRQQVITDPTTKEKSTINYMSINQAKDALKKTPLEGNALANWAIANFVDPATLAEATGMTINQINALLAKAKADKAYVKKEGGLLSLANGGLAAGGMPDKEFTDNTTGIKYYFDFANGMYRPETSVKDGITYRWNPVSNKYETTSASGTGIASLGGGDGGSPAGGENTAARPEGSYDISSNINPYTGSINALANGPVGTVVGKIAGLFGPQVSLNNAPVVDIAGTPTQAAKDYGKSSWGKTGDEGQDIGTIAPDPYSVDANVDGGGRVAGGNYGSNGPGGDPALNAKGGYIKGYEDGGSVGEGFGYGEGAGAAQGAGMGGYGSSGEGYGEGYGDFDNISSTTTAITDTQKALNDFNMAMLNQSSRPVVGGYNNAVMVSRESQDSAPYANAYGYQDAQQARDAYDSFVAEQSMSREGAGGNRAKGGYIGHYAQGGLGSLGGYSDGGRLLRGPGDGVSDSIPASIGNRQPARLADGEFVVPARIVSELGNGSTEAGARALYKMMARIQANRRKTTGKNRVAVDSKSHKYLPA